MTCEGSVNVFNFITLRMLKRETQFFVRHQLLVGIRFALNRAKQALLKHQGRVMEELFYFPSFDLLIKIKYAKDTNSLRYSTHRIITFEERKVIDRYILHDVGPKTDFYQHAPSLLLYIGVDVSLEKELRFYRLRDTIKDVLDHKLIVDKEVKELISKSLGNYYFERVGDELISLRKLIKERSSEEKIEYSISKIITLLEAYNIYAKQKVDIENILPKEIVKNYLQFSQSASLV
jgi:hypothetical protein